MKRLNSDHQEGQSMWEECLFAYRLTQECIMGASLQIIFILNTLPENLTLVNFTIKAFLEQVVSFVQFNLEHIQTFKQIQSYFLKEKVGPAFGYFQDQLQ